MIGPFTPGYRANPDTLRQLADVGLIFLMFGVGLHFNLRELAAARRVAIPAALLQIALVVAAAPAFAVIAGLSSRESILLGMAASISSTVVLVRVLEERGLMGSDTGRTLVGWLIVQDLVTIVMLLFVPLLADGQAGNLWGALGTTLRAGAFAALALTLGTRLVPPLLGLVGRTGSRELFLLAVVCLSLGIAIGAETAGTSLALGAFIAGVTVSETEASHRAASELLPLRDAFAVLFFVSIGMLVNPTSRETSAVLIAVSVVAVIGLKGLASLAAATLFGASGRTALLAASGLAQSGEFSFILAEAGRSTGLLSQGGYQALLMAAVLSIAINPLLVRLGESRGRHLNDRALWRSKEIVRSEMGGPADPAPEVVIVGAGRVGRLAGRALEMVGTPHLYIDTSLDQVRVLRSEGHAAHWGDASRLEILEGAGIGRARLLVIAVPDVDSARLVAEGACELNPNLTIVSRAHTLTEVQLLLGAGATTVVIPEFEGAVAIVRDVLLRLGLAADEVINVTEASRSQEYGNRDIAV
ncbi:MAG: hypothetical protein EPO16_04095, partial [Dehalococcoidia bacterium]